MGHTTATFRASDGLELATYAWTPDDAAPRAVVQLAHGMAEHAARYDHVARALVAEGYAVYAHDHRGHGRTAKTDEELGWCAERDGWDQAVRDLHDLTMHWRAQHPGLPLALVAHSMGSFMAQQALILHGKDYDAVALSGSNGKGGALLAAGGIVARAERRRLGPRGRSKLLNFMSFGSFNNAFKPARTDFDWLSRDPAQVDKYIADPRCGFLVTTQFWVDFLRGLQFIEQPEHQARVPSGLPLYIFAGSEDPVSQRTKGLRQLLDAYQKAGLTQVEHRFYPGARHETFNETNRDEVIRDLLAWMGRALPAKP
jgi:alpha-beta hydrolase superfamily lysophospholipase